MINYDEEVSRFKYSLEVSAAEDEIVKSDLTDMRDIMLELIKKQAKEQH
jgi:hypothetical protein